MKLPFISGLVLAVVVAFLSAACANDYDQFNAGGPAGTGGATGTGGSAEAGAPASGGAAGSPAIGGASAVGGMAGAGGDGAACEQPSVSCDGVCTMVEEDAENCGGCGNSCATGFDCSGSLCGCTSVTACGSGSGASQRMCDNRLCVCQSVTCKPGESCRAGDSGQECTCNGGARCRGADEACCEDGCQNLRTNPDNCGACGRICPEGFACAAGECVAN